MKMPRYCINIVLIIATTIALGYIAMGVALHETFLKMKSQCELELMVNGKFNKTGIKIDTHNNFYRRCSSKFLANHYLSSSVELLSGYLIIAGFVIVTMTYYTFRHVQTNVNWKLLKNHAIITSVTNIITLFFTMIVYDFWKLKNESHSSDDLNDEKELFGFYHVLYAIYMYAVVGTIISCYTLVPMGITANDNGIGRSENGRMDNDGAEEVISSQSV